MSCTTFEEQIYGYRELSGADRQALEGHAAGCAACRVLLAEVKQHGAWVRLAAADKPAVGDPAQLTRTIMQALEPQRRQVAMIDSRWLRYGLSAASVLLLALFILERPWSAQPVNQSVAAAEVPAERAVVMDSRMFMEARRRNRGVHEKNVFTSYAACITGGAPCPSHLVMNFKNKMKL